MHLLKNLNPTTVMQELSAQYKDIDLIGRDHRKSGNLPPDATDLPPPPTTTQSEPQEQQPQPPDVPTAIWEYAEDDAPHSRTTQLIQGPPWHRVVRRKTYEKLTGDLLEDVIIDHDDTHANYEQPFLFPTNIHVEYHYRLPDDQNYRIDTPNESDIEADAEVPVPTSAHAGPAHSGSAHSGTVAPAGTGQSGRNTPVSTISRYGNAPIRNTLQQALLNPELLDTGRRRRDDASASPLDEPDLQRQRLDDGEALTVSSIQTANEDFNRWTAEVWRQMLVVSKRERGAEPDVRNTQVLDSDTGSDDEVQICDAYITTEPEPRLPVKRAFQPRIAKKGRKEK